MKEYKYLIDSRTGYFLSKSLKNYYLTIGNFLLGVISGWCDDNL